MQSETQHLLLAKSHVSPTLKPDFSEDFASVSFPIVPIFSIIYVCLWKGKVFSLFLYCCFQIEIHFFQPKDHFLPMKLVILESNISYSFQLLSSTELPVISWRVIIVCLISWSKSWWFFYAPIQSFKCHGFLFLSPVYLQCTTLSPS